MTIVTLALLSLGLMALVVLLEPQEVGEDPGPYQAVLDEVLRRNDASHAVTLSTTYSANPKSQEILDLVATEPALTSAGIDAVAFQRLVNHLPEKSLISWKASSRLTVVSEEEMIRLMSRHFDYTKGFYSEYPKALGLITFNRAGLNDTGDSAAVLVDLGSLGEGRTLQFFYLRKANGRWRIVHRKELLADYRGRLK